MMAHTSDDLANAKCPLCHERGGLAFDFVSRAFRCDRCSAQGITRSMIDFAEAMDKVPKTKPPNPRTRRQQETPPARADDDDADVVEDRYRDRDGKVVSVRMVAPRRQARYVPDLDVTEGMLAFTRWRLAKEIANERRYGRDWLRQRGYRVVAKRRDEQGRLIRVLRRDD